MSTVMHSTPTPARCSIRGVAIGAVVLGAMLAALLGFAAPASAADDGGDTDVSVIIPAAPAPSPSPVNPPPAGPATPPTGGATGGAAGGGAPSAGAGRSGSGNGAAVGGGPAAPADIAPATEPAIGTEPEPGSLPEVVLDEEIYMPGDTITATAAGFTAGEQVQVVLFSDPVLIGNFTAGVDGSVSTAFGVPKDILAGAHTVQFTGWASDGIATGDVMIGTPTAAVNSVQGIPTFIWWIGGGVLGLLALGFVGFLAIRAMREAPAVAPAGA